MKIILYLSSIYIFFYSSCNIGAEEAGEIYYRNLSDYDAEFYFLNDNDSTEIDSFSFRSGAEQVVNTWRGGACNALFGPRDFRVDHVFIDFSKDNKRFRVTKDITYYDNYSRVEDDTNGPDSVGFIRRLLRCESADLTNEYLEEESVLVEE